MATPYSKVRLKFLEKISDFNISEFIDSEKDAIIDGYMISSCSHFDKCKVDLSDRDDALEEFNGNLTDKIIEIIVEGMIVEWLKPKVLHTDNLSNFLNGKDLSLASAPSAILKEVKDTLKMSREEFKRLIKEYSYNSSNLSELTL